MSQSSGIAASNIATFRPNIAVWLACCLLAVNSVLAVVWIIGLIAGVEAFPGEFRRQFGPNEEGNFVTWYSNLLLTLIAVTALTNFWLDSLKKADRSPLRFAWIGVCVVTLILSLEEVAQLHETAQRSLEEWTKGRGEWARWLGTPGRAWVLPYLPGILVVVVGFLVTFLRMFKNHRAPLTLAITGICLWVLALVSEFFFIDIWNAWGGWYYGLEVVLEEGAEILGSSSLLLAFVLYAQHRLGGFVGVDRRNERKR
jgi:hypothetical protein